MCDRAPAVGLILPSGVFVNWKCGQGRCGVGGEPLHSEQAKRIAEYN